MALCQQNQVQHAQGSLGWLKVSSSAFNFGNSAFKFLAPTPHSPSHSRYAYSVSYENQTAADDSFLSINKLTRARRR